MLAISEIIQLLQAEAKRVPLNTEVDEIERIFASIRERYLKYGGKLYQDILSRYESIRGTVADKNFSVGETIKSFYAYCASQLSTHQPELSEQYHQNILIEKMNDAGYEVNKEGMCYGISTMAMQAFLAEDMASFDKRIETIVGLKEIKSNLSNISDSKLKTDILAFFDGISLNQAPEFHVAMFQKKLTQKISRTMPFSLPISLDSNDKKPTIVATFCSAYTKAELSEYLTLLADELGTQKSFSLDLVGSFNLGLHAINLNYNHQTRRWLLIDPNNLPGIEYLTPKLLADDLFKAFLQPDQLFLSTDVWMTEENARQKSIQNLLDNPAWAKLNDIAKISNQKYWDIRELLLHTSRTKPSFLEKVMQKSVLEFSFYVQMFNYAYNYDDQDIFKVLVKLKSHIPFLEHHCIYRMLAFALKHNLMEEAKALIADPPFNSPEKWWRITSEDQPLMKWIIKLLTTVPTGDSGYQKMVEVARKLLSYAIEKDNQEVIDLFFSPAVPMSLILTLQDDELIKAMDVIRKLEPKLSNLSEIKSPEEIFKKILNGLSTDRMISLAKRIQELFDQALGGGDFETAANLITRAEQIDKELFFTLHQAQREIDRKKGFTHSRITKDFTLQQIQEHVVKNIKSRSFKALEKISQNYLFPSAMMRDRFEESKKQSISLVSNDSKSGIKLDQTERINPEQSALNAPGNSSENRLSTDFPDKESYNDPNISDHQNLNIQELSRCRDKCFTELENLSSFRLAPNDEPMDACIKSYEEMIITAFSESSAEKFKTILSDIKASIECANSASMRAVKFYMSSLEKKIKRRKERTSPKDKKNLILTALLEVPVKQRVNILDNQFKESKKVQNAITSSRSYISINATERSKAKLQKLKDQINSHSDTFKSIRGPNQQ